MDFFGFILKFLMFGLGVFLVLFVLVQRGRGGGLAGALGGRGGQSAFGTKAGDLFTRVTIITAAVWILLCASAVKYFKPERAANPFGSGGAVTVPGPGSSAPAPQPGAPGAADAVPPATPAEGQAPAQQ